MKDETPTRKEEKTEDEKCKNIGGLKSVELLSSPKFIREFKEKTTWKGDEVNDEVSNLLCDPNVSIYVK